MKCKYCGTKNEDDKKYCINCGMPLEYGKLLNCYNCGISVKPKYTYCPECGVELKLKRRCPKCKVLVKFDDKFCKNCGHKLEEIDIEKKVEEKEKEEEDNIEIEENQNGDSELSEFVDECIEKGLNEYADEEYKEAIEYFNEGVGTILQNDLDRKEDTRLVDLYIYRGDAFSEIGELDRARDNYKRGLIYAQSILAVEKVEKIKEKITKL